MVTCYTGRSKVCYSHRITLAGLLIVNVDPDPLGETVLSGFSTVKLLFFSSSHAVLWEEVSMHRPHLRSGRLCSSSWKAKDLHKFFGVPLYGRFVYFFHNDLFIQYKCHYKYQFTSIWTPRYLFYILDYNTLFSCSHGSVFGH